MKRTIIESPYSAPTTTGIESNVNYGFECVYDCLRRGETPYASHLLLTPVLDDTAPLERAWGIAAGQAWLPVVDQVAVYTDRGISPGMQMGIDAAEKEGVLIVYRKLGKKP